MEPYTGEIRVFAGSFAPTGWLFCQGQLLKINDYDALFALIGTSYGGDGINTFALPSLSGRVVVGQGQLRGGADYLMAQPLGQESVSLNSTQLPTHAHPFTGTLGVSTGTTATATANPTNHYFGGNGGKAYTTDLGENPGTLGDGAVIGKADAAGGGQPHANIQPVLALNYIICLNGIYPSQP